MSTKRDRGRPSKLTPATQQTIISYLHDGNTLDTAASAAGVHRVTLHEWMARGRSEPSGPYVEFLNALTEAQAKAEIDLVTCVRKAAKKDWRAAMALLERRFHREWGKRTFLQVEIQGIKNALQKIRPHVDPLAYDKFLAALEGNDEDLLTGDDNELNSSPIRH